MNAEHPPCPFCAQPYEPSHPFAPISNVAINRAMGKTAWFIECVCGARGSFALSVGGAWAAWANNRVPALADNRKAVIEECAALCDRIGRNRGQPGVAQSAALECAERLRALTK